MIIGDWEICFAATQGTRAEQQDAYACEVWKDTPSGAPGVVLSIADGMGGYAGGAMTSQSAVTTSLEAFLSFRGSSLQDRLMACCQAANQAVADLKANDDPELRNSGSTLVVACLDRGVLSWVSVGDSVLWLLRQGTIQRLNRDHSMGPVLDQLVQDGELSQHDALNDPQRHVLRSALTGSLLRLIDVKGPVRLARKDQVIAATDGVLPVCNKSLLKALAPRGDLQASLETVLAGLNGQEPQDNATIGVCRRRSRWFM